MYQGDLVYLGGLVLFAHGVLEQAEEVFLSAVWGRQMIISMATLTDGMDYPRQTMTIGSQCQWDFSPNLVWFFSGGKRWV